MNTRERMVLIRALSALSYAAGHIAVQPDLSMKPHPYIEGELAYLRSELFPPEPDVEQVGGA